MLQTRGVQWRGLVPVWVRVLSDPADSFLGHKGLPVHGIAVVKTAVGGAGTAYTDPLTGYIDSVEYVKGDFADGSTIEITGVDANGTLGAIPILTETAINASTVRRPRAATHTVLGAAALYAGSGVAVLDRIWLDYAKVKVVVASGGDLTSGTFHIFVADR